jgi:hypothetical protein
MRTNSPNTQKGEPSLSTSIPRGATCLAQSGKSRHPPRRAFLPLACPEPAEWALLPRFVRPASVDREGIYYCFVIAVAKVGQPLLAVRSYSLSLPLPLPLPLLLPLPLPLLLPLSLPSPLLLPSPSLLPLPLPT